VSKEIDPFAVLGVSAEASPDEIRQSYLRLVRQFPPDHAPEKFQEIRLAYESASNPLVVAEALVDEPPPSPEWSQVLDAQAEIPPRMSPAFVLGLGNRTRPQIAQ